MNNSIEPEKLSETVSDMLSEYAKHISQATDEELLEATKQLKQDIKNNSRVFHNSKKGYASGWSYRKTSRKGEDTSYVVFNRTHYPLTHLLEYGHTKWLWGQRTDGYVPGRAHIRPAEAKMKKNLIQRIKVRISKI